MLRGIHHVAIATADLDRLRAFYEMVGFTAVAEVGWDRGNTSADTMTGLTDTAATIVTLQLGDTYLELYEYAEPRAVGERADVAANEPGIVHFGLTSSDVWADYERLRAGGMTFRGEPHPTLGATHGEDPDGNVIELVPLAFTRDGDD